MADGKPKYVTAMAESNTPGGWRPSKVETGCLIDVESGQTVARGFAMPHSPRIHMGHVWLLDSGRGALVRVDPADGTVETVARFPGYARGLAMIGKLAFVGLSKIRETSTFGGVPVAEDRERLKCGVGVVNLETGKLAGQLEFTSGVDEIFDVSLLQGSRLTAMRGPFAREDGARTIWTVPTPSDVGIQDTLNGGETGIVWQTPIRHLSGDVPCVNQNHRRPSEIRNEDDHRAATPGWRGKMAGSSCSTLWRHGCFSR